MPDLFEVSETEELAIIRELIPSEHLVNTYVCGGYPAFCFDLTTCFSDIDLYFKDRETYEAVASCLRNNSTVRNVFDGPYATTFRKIMTKIRIQCIFCITGDVFNVLGSFDLNICRCAITFSNEGWQGYMSPSIERDGLQLACISNPIRTASRVAKYAARMKRQPNCDKLYLRLFEIWDIFDEDQQTKLRQELSHHA